MRKKSSGNSLEPADLPDIAPQTSLHAQAHAQSRAQAHANMADYASWLRSTAPYINTHRARTFVLAIGGDALAHENFVHITHDIALMTSLGVRLILVHGARQQIEAALTAGGSQPRYQHHLRVTDEHSMAIVRDVVGGLQIQIEARLSTGMPGTPMHNSRVRVVSGNFVAARPMGVVDGIDLGFTGSVRRIDVVGIRAQLDQGNIVLLSPLGYSPSGEAFNLNADDLAAAVAIATGADKLIMLDDYAGVLDDEGAVLSELTPRELQAIVDRMPPTSSRAVRLNALLRAARGGVTRAHVVSYVNDGALLNELFTHVGSGTQVVEQSYETLRDASQDDVAGIIGLIRPLEEAGALVYRSREVLERECDRFVVAELDGLIIGCAALYAFADEAAGELACLAIHPEYRQRRPRASHASEAEFGDAALTADAGAPSAKAAAKPPTKTLGESLLAEIEQRARREGLVQLFALTTQTSDWFREHGFRTADINALPTAKQALYNLQRNSKVLIKYL